jgi:hypothetical protein
MNKVSKGFYVGVFLVGALGNWITWAIVSALRLAYPDKEPVRRMLMIPASWLGLLSAVVFLILIYKMWAAIQGMGARTSAGKALGFMFIPLFNLYWAFQAYWGWTKDYNRIAQRDNVELPRMPEGIALAICVLPLVSTCFVVAGIIVGGLESMKAGGFGNIGMQASMLVGLVNTILMAVLFSNICDGINALVDAGLVPQRPERVAPIEGAKVSVLAILSLILGICGFCTAGLSAIAGLIVGIIGIVVIRNSAGRLTGRGLAIAGTAVSGASLFIFPIMLAAMLPALAQVKGLARTQVVISNARQLSLAAIMYCDENDGRFPPADNWPDALAPYLGRGSDVLNSPFDPEAGRAWAMNAGLDGKTMVQVQEKSRTVLLYEARFDSPTAGGAELLPEQPRGSGGYIIAFVDGHIESVGPERLDELIWDPAMQGSVELKELQTDPTFGPRF